MRRSEVGRNGEIRLTRKQSSYFQGVRAGKSRRQAALAAGYSQSSADNPGYNIERRVRGGNPIIRLVMDSIRREQAFERDGAEEKEQCPIQVQPDQ